MDRRSFLKMMGLGGTALTLPKPLNVVAARMADLTDPPIHAGLARFRDLGGVMVNDFTLNLHLSSFANLARYVDFSDRWRVHMAAHEDGREYAPILDGMAVNLQIPEQDAYRNSLYPESCRNRLPSRRLIGTMLDVWIVPEGNPPYVLPPLTVTLHGEAIKRRNVGSIEKKTYVFDNFGYPMDLSAQVRSVRLERARAIELGLATPSDPYEIV